MEKQSVRQELSVKSCPFRQYTGNAAKIWIRLGSGNSGGMDRPLNGLKALLTQIMLHPTGVFQRFVRFVSDITHGVFLRLCP